MIWVATHLAVVGITLATLAASAIILQQRRTPQSTAAWLLFIVLVPYLALPLFLGLGFRKQGKRFNAIAFSETPSPAHLDKRFALDVTFQKFGIPAASAGNSFTLIATPQMAYRSLIELIESAEKSLDAMFYVVANDVVGQSFVDALAIRARDGVSVRLIIDRLGSVRPPRAAIQQLRAAGGQVRFFSPFLRRTSSGHLNLRNHRKMVIADRSHVFAGGMNVGEDYMGEGTLQPKWTDLAYLLEGPSVRTFHDVFRSDWMVTAGTAGETQMSAVPAAVGSAITQLVPSGPDTKADPLHDAVVNAIHVASRRVWIVTPYFLPTELLSNALITAARRGVDVRILLPERSNQRLADFARGAYLREMQDAGCKLLFFQPGMIHAKTVVLDAAAYVGSANFDVRSMLLNFECVLFVYDEASVEALTNWFAQQERHCRQGISPSGRLRRIGEGVFRLGAPVL